MSKSRLPAHVLTQCLQRIRSFSTSQTRPAGHNKWSKIKHDKAKVDASVNKQRSVIAQELCQASKGRSILENEARELIEAENGPNPQFNPRLATAIATAKKSGFPKASLESAIARGQGLSVSGTPLTNLTLEAMVPPSVACIVECQTDSKLRTLGELKHLLKEFGGSVTATSHLFERRGKIVLENSKGLREEDIFDSVVETGATDVEFNEDGNVTVYTEPARTAATSKDLAAGLNFRIVSSDLVWHPKHDTMVEVEATSEMHEFLGRLRDNSSVQEVYINAA